MSEPTRWRDEGPDAVRALLRDAPGTRRMTADDRARTRARLAPLAGVAVGVGSFAWLQGAAIGAGLAVLTVGAVEIGSAVVSHEPPGNPAPAASVVYQRPRAPASPASTAPSPVEPPAPVAPSAPEPSPRPAARPTEAPPPRDADTLAEEAALLERARASLGTSPAGALAITEEHAAKFPGGKLSVERELLAIDALRRLGRVAEARSRGEALLSRAQGSLYEDRIRKLLDGLR
jgi:type IV secretory pathway VirB10-like protein